MPNDATAPNERAIAACSWLENLKSFSLLFFDSAQFLEKINAQLVSHRYFLVHRGTFVQNMQHSITITVFLVGDEYKLVEKDLGFNFPSPTREVRGGEKSTEATFEWFLIVKTSPGFGEQFSSQIKLLLGVSLSNGSFSIGNANEISSPSLSAMVLNLAGKFQRAMTKESHDYHIRRGWCSVSFCFIPVLSDFFWFFFTFSRREFNKWREAFLKKKIIDKKLNNDNDDD